MRKHRMRRREFLATLSAGAVGLLAAACGADQAIELPTKTPASAGAACR